VLLERNEHPALVHIGVRRDESGAFQAHAWTESDGHKVIGGAEAESYHVIARLQEAGLR
jgi:hypothetical protein